MVESLSGILESAHEGTLPPACEDMPEVGAEAAGGGRWGFKRVHLAPLCSALIGS